MVTVRRVRTEQDIKSLPESSGSKDCALKGFRQGKKVFICHSEDNVDEVTKTLLKEIGELNV